jgi:hypothetical protein
VEIISPQEGDQFAYNRASPGILKIDLHGTTEDCDEEITWEIEDVGYSEKKIEPPKGDSSLVRFRGLPEYNTDFGKKKITALACGKSTSVVVEVYYNPDAKNHPGEGSAVTPNWFHYWGQTKAGKGFSPIYEPERKSQSTGGLAQAQYDYYADKIVLTNQVLYKSCFGRPGGKESLGIDCYAELLRHESWHQKERWEWWGNTNPLALGFIDRREMDLDGDLVPDKIEENLSARKCSKWDAYSCQGRPKDSLLDVEMDAYQKGWEWRVGSANKEDWSSCKHGKQWKKGKACE